MLLEGKQCLGMRHHLMHSAVRKSLLECLESSKHKLLVGKAQRHQSDLCNELLDNRLVQGVADRQHRRWRRSKVWEPTASALSHCPELCAGGTAKRTTKVARSRRADVIRLVDEVPLVVWWCCR